MEQKLYLLSEILKLNNSNIKAIIDSEMSIHELIFSDSDYLQERLKLNKSLISRISALKKLISGISFKELRKRKKIKKLEEAVRYLKTMLCLLKRECFMFIFLDNGNILIDQIKIRGSIDNVQLDYRFVMRRALVSKAAGIICAHNHPSGNVNSSTADRCVTSELKKY